MCPVKGFKAMREEIELGSLNQILRFFCTVGNLTVLILLQLLSFESFDESERKSSISRPREENK
jgi:hypothetical protein